MNVTAEDIAQLLASAPPRLIPSHVAKAAMGGRAAWFLALFGLVFGGMGLLFTLLFFPWRFQDDWRLAAATARVTPGVITNVSRTGMSVNKTRVIEYDFRYITEEGQHRTGRCFTTGTLWSVGNGVNVRYLPAEPDLACIEGARLSEVGWGGAFVIVFPLVGGGLICWFVVDRRRKRRLLQEGLVAEVNIVSVENTNARVNNQNVYKITVASSALAGGQPVMVRRFNPADVNLALKHLRDKQPVFVLYDPRNPRQLIFPEALIDSE